MTSTAEKLAVVAVGGNSLIIDDQHASIPYQARAAAYTAHRIMRILDAGWKVVVTHGNGPQVGFILRRSELGSHEVPPIPMNYATSNTQGSIGFMFQKALGNEFRRASSDRRVVTLITQTLVDRDDPAFATPTKFIGPQLDEATAKKHAEQEGWIVKEDSGRGWRRVVPSPRPRAIVELETIRDLVARDTVVIACGGGGLPVVEAADGTIEGVEAVIDKDYASGLLARELGAELFIISTAVPRVAVDWNRPSQRWLDKVTLAEGRAYLDAGQFPAGSMGPKVEAVLDFVAATGGRGIITDPQHLAHAVDGDGGTQFVAD